MQDIPRPAFIIVPYPPPPGVITASIVTTFNTVSWKPVLHVSFNIATAHPTYDAILASNEFGVFPVTDPGAWYPFSKTLLSNLPAQELRRRQQKTLLNCLWHLRCKRSPEHSFRVSGREIMVGEVIAAIGHKKRDL